MKNKPTIKWVSKLHKEDYTAAFSYLSLIYEEEDAKKFISKLKEAPEVDFKAKDIFRASSLPLLAVNNYHVKQDIAKIKKGVTLLPLLLVRDTANGKVVIADGYHRLCAIYSFEEDAAVPCHIV